MIRLLKILRRRQRWAKGARNESAVVPQLVPVGSRHSLQVVVGVRWSGKVNAKNAMLPIPKDVQMAAELGTIDGHPQL